MRALYSLLIYLMILPTILRLLWRGVRQRSYWHRWGERFGCVQKMQGPVIWVHAVSVGEVRAAVPLVRALQRDYPEYHMLVTTMTPTGSETVHQQFGNSVAHCYVPYDLSSAVTRFLRRTKPALALIMETELWPNLFHACRARGIPLVVVNARLSEKSAAGYQRFASLARSTLADVSLIGAQTSNDAKRLRALGANAVEVTGSIKFEISVPDGLTDRANALRAGFGARPVWVAASTREGEETLLLDAFRSLRASFPTLLLLLVPRHPQRFDEVARLCQEQGYRVERRSARPAAIASDTDILIGDTMGELLLFYAAADVAFIGGSLKPLGGQNLLESLAVGTPVVFGPHMFNFSDISRLAIECGAGRKAQSKTELASVVAEFLSDASMRQQAGSAGQRMVAENRGALSRTLQLVRQVMAG